MEEKESKKDVVDDESNVKTSDDTNEVKAKDEKKPRKVNALTIVLIVLILIVIILMIIQMATGGVQKVFNKVRYSITSSNTIGNSVANIRNYGYITTGGKYIYYMSPSETGTSLALYKAKIDDPVGTKEMLTESTAEYLSLNYMNGYLYFITMEDSSDEDDEVDNKICKMSVDGGDVEVLNDNEFHNSCYEIYVLKNEIFYIGEDECIYSMDLKGNNKTKLNDDGCGFVGITDEYIIYTNVEELDTESEDEDSVTTQNVTYIMNLDGSDPHPIIENQYLYNISVVGDYIYYQTEAGYPSRVKVDGTDNILISDDVLYTMVVTEDGIFYLDYYYEDDSLLGIGLYKMDLDGKSTSLLTLLDDSTSFLCAIDGYLFLSDDNANEGRFELVSVDGNQILTLYKLDLTAYTSSDDTDEEEEDADDPYVVNDEDVIYYYDATEEDETEDDE